MIWRIGALTSLLVFSWSYLSVFAGKVKAMIVNINHI